ncbi:MAG: DoxX family protein [Acidobacteriota bacterium]
MRLLYWISTALVVLFLLASALTYFFHRATIEGVRELGFPDFFRLQLAVLKLVAVVVLLLPIVPLVAKDWAYAGTALFLLTAIVAHTAHRDPITLSLVSVVMFALLVASRISLHRLLAGC